MCLIYGIILWIKYGGKMLIIFQPSPHVVICSKTGIYHGTNRSGKWKIEEMTNKAFSNWLIPQSKKVSNE